VCALDKPKNVCTYDTWTGANEAGPAAGVPALISEPLHMCIYLSMYSILDARHGRKLNLKDKPVEMEFHRPR